MLSSLRDAGFVTTHTVWFDDSGQTYTSEGRSITLVRVVRPFALVSVRYWFSAEANHRAIRFGCADADRWAVTGRTYAVPAGWYLVGAAGDFVFDTVSVVDIGATDGDSHPGDIAESLAYHIAEEFGASRCVAQCGSCAVNWEAADGSWHFEPESDCEAGPWWFDDAEDFADDGTVSCPSCRTGRVGFLIN